MNKLLFIGLLGVTCLLSCEKNTVSSENSFSQKEETVVIRSVDSREAKELLEQEKDIVLLDVRTPDEFELGHLAGAKNMDFHASDFGQQLQDLNPDEKYMLYCAVGGRSGKTMQMMENLGFKQVYNVTEGFTELSSNGIPVEKGKME